METRHWHIDELSHAGSEHLDTSYVPGYDRKSGTGPAVDLALLRELGLSERHMLVDLGAGTGTFALTVESCLPGETAQQSRVVQRSR